MLVRFGNGVPFARQRPQMGFSISPDWGSVAVTEPAGTFTEVKPYEEAGTFTEVKPYEEVGTFTAAKPSGILAISSVAARAAESINAAVSPAPVVAEPVVQSMPSQVYTAPPASSSSSAGWGGGSSGGAYGGGGVPAGAILGEAGPMQPLGPAGPLGRRQLTFDSGGAGGSGLPFGLTPKQLLIGGAAVLAFMYFTSGGGAAGALR